MLPSRFLLMSKTHLQLTRFRVGLEGTSSHIPFQTEASNSIDITFRHVEYLRALVTDMGSRA